MAGLFVGFVLMVMASVGLFLGVKLARVMGDRFEELLPQRMVDYAGFIDVAAGKD